MLSNAQLDSPIRLVTEEDIPWLHELCSNAYPPGYYEPDTAEAWVRSMINSDKHLVMRASRAWIVACVQNGVPWNSKLKFAYLLPVSSLGGAREEVTKLIWNAVCWARRNGAKQFHFSAITGFDFGKIVCPMGAKQSSPSYILEL